MLLAIDFETYFDSDCTLKKLNYIQYLNHPKFEVLGAAVLADDRHEFLTHDELVDFLDDLDPSETDVLAYNTLFDGCILAWRYGFKPRKWLDALSMARGALALPSHSLDAVAQYFGLPSKKAATFKGKTWSELTFEEQRELSDYAEHDVWLCHEIYDKLMPYPQDELDLIDLTIRMFVEPRLELDLPLANELLLEQRTHKETLREASGLTSTQLSSNKQLAELIKERYQLDPPTKISPTTGKETWAFSKNDPEFEAFHASAPPELKSLLDARIAIKSTIEETRLETLIETQEFVGKIPAQLVYHGAHTGRWSSSGGTNLLNLPKKSRIRNTLIAPPDHVLLIADSASIEARVLAWFAEQEDLIEIFHNKGDPYKHMASAIYNTPIDQITKEQRNVGKQAVLGCIAAGELVLTREKGRIPIERVTTEHTVWDGVTWVHHDGVVYQGVKKVIYHDGLWATPDHKVYLENNESDQITLQEAKDANEPLWSISNMHLLHDIPTPRQSPVYDILNAGPRHRFTVSDCLVSNCGYGMGANKFHATAAKAGVILSDEEAARIVQIYRQTNNKIKNLWYLLNDKLPTIAEGPATSGFFVTHNEYKCVTFEKNAIRLPNGLTLKYPNLRVNDEGEWIYGDNRKIYAGAMAENIVQALARIVIGEQALRAHREVAPVVLLVHDEIVCVAPKQSAKTELEQLLEIMRTPPTWAPDLPLDAEGEVSAFYKK